MCGKCIPSVVHHTRPSVSRSEIFDLFRQAWALQRLQECDQIGLLLLGQIQIEAFIVELHDIVQRGSSSVMEIRSTSGKTAQNRPFYLSNVSAFARYHGAANIGDMDCWAPIAALHRINRQ